MLHPSPEWRPNRVSFCCPTAHFYKMFQDLAFFTSPVLWKIRLRFNLWFKRFVFGGEGERAERKSRCTERHRVTDMQATEEQWCVENPKTWAEPTVHPDPATPKTVAGDNLPHCPDVTLTRWVNGRCCPWSPYRLRGLEGCGTHHGMPGRVFLGWGETKLWEKDGSRWFGIFVK